MDGWMDGWLAGWMDGWMDVSASGVKSAVMIRGDVHSYLCCKSGVNWTLRIIWKHSAAACWGVRLPIEGLAAC